ncbi:MAG TPA: hypothetical protein VM328_04550, partial [Fimbriimonadaceae bacterium]|nr:hypothetical protein [Fimbriimonadaceae bacterium]
FAEHAPELAPAYGLALQGLEMESVSANILPATIIRQQVWRTKGKWSIAAAACMAIAASIPILRLTLDRSAYAASRQQHSSTIQGAIQVADEKVRRLKEVETEDPRPRIENIRAIHDRTDVWPMLLLDIQRALAEANQQAGLKNGDPKEVKRIERRNRRELHVTEVFAQYLPDGKSADQQGRGGSSPMAGGMMFGGGSDGESPAATEESAANPAMIVTVRGYTPFRDPHNFVLDTFVRWLSEQAQSTERRPYRIASVSVPEFKRRGEDQGARRDVASGRSTFGAPSFGADFGSIGGSRNNFGRPANPRDPSQRERQLRGVRQLPAPNSTTLSPGGTEPGTEAPKDVWDFFPSDPLADEDTAYDMSFELTFRVELHPPEVARKSDEEFKKWLVEQEAKARGEEAAAEGEGLVTEGDEQAEDGEATEPQESESNP